MKYNLNKISSTRRESDTVDAILNNMIFQFCQLHDIRCTSPVKRYIGDPMRGLPRLVAWMKTLGWNVEYWSLPDAGDGNGPLAYGLDFENSCPLFMEARLKYS